MSDPLATADAGVHSSSPAAAEASCPPAPARSRRIPTIYTPSPALSLPLAANREQAEDFFLPYFDTFASSCNINQAPQYSGSQFVDLDAVATYHNRMQGQSFTSLLTSSNTELLWRQEILRGQQQQHTMGFQLSRAVTETQYNEIGAPVTPEKRQPGKVVGRQQQQQGDHHLQTKNTDTMGCHCASPEFELSSAVSGAETHQYKEIGASSRGVSGTCDQPQAPVTPEKKQPKKAAAATAQGRKRPHKVPGQSPSNAPIDLLQQQQVPKNSFDLNELPERPRKHRPRVAKDKPPKTPRKRGRPRKQQQEDPTGQQQPPRPYIPTSTVEILVSSYVSNSSSSREWELTHGVQGQANKRKGRSSLAGESQKKRSKADGGLQSQPSHNRGYDVLNGDALRGLNDEALELVYLMEKLIEGMKKMHLDSEGGLEIVEYKGFSGPVVPFMPPKKKKPRAKVVLDMETNRMWNLLMIKGAKEEHVDQDSAKRWEQDRLMMEQRAELFISRMHLVQGNRCFSKWKGSVVDSVVGAFLTQNVSDHLSSSAFMSVASRFPIKKDSQKLGTEGCIPQNCGQCLQTSTPRKEEVRIKAQARGKKQQNSHGLVQEEDNLYKQEGFGSRAKRALFAAEPEEESKEEVNTEEQQVFIQEPVEIGNSYVVQIDDSNSTSMLQEFCSGGLSKVDNVANASGGTEEGAFTGIPSLDDNMALQYKQKQSLDMNNAANLNMEGGNFVVASEKQQSLGMNNAANLNIEGGNFVVASEKQQQSLGMNSAANLNIEGGQTVVALEKQQQSLGTNSVGNLNIEGSQTVVASEVPERLNVKMKPSGIDLAKLEQSQGTSKNSYKWDTLRSKVLKNQDSSQNEFFKSPTSPPPDSLDWEAVRLADVKELADVIKERGMNNVLAGRIKAFLERVHEEHGTINLEWLREIPPEDAKEFLLSIRGLGLKSVECIRLLTLEHLAFPVDTNVGRICVRLGWVPIEPLPEELQLHLLELYPVQATIQKYLWPRLCTLDQRTLYELHYQMITFGKVFCTKSKPNCNACPMRQDCKHFASAFASARLALPAPAQQNGDQEEESSLRLALAESVAPLQKASASEAPETVIRLQNVGTSEARERCEPIIEEPTTPEPCSPECPDIEDYPLCLLDEDSILKINLTELGETDKGKETAAGQSSKALVLVPPEFAYIPVPKLKNEGRLRTVHYVYELPDNHPLLYEMEARETDDPCYYLLAIWSPGEEAGAPPTLSECDYSTFADVKESNDETVKGTLLVPCRSAMRGNFPLNGTYFQVNEVFADQATSLHPMDVPRASLWNLRRRFVYFGTSVTSIFRGLTTEEIQACFWRGYVCVRGFDQKTRAPRPLAARFHLPASFKRVAAKKTANGN